MTTTVSWQGECQSLKEVRRLRDYLLELAALSHKYYTSSPPHYCQPELWSLKDLEEEHAALRIYEGLEVVPNTKLLLVGQPGGVQCIQLPSKVATLEGIEFRLYDPRYPVYDKLSFVFLYHSYMPELDGINVIFEKPYRVYTSKGELLETRGSGLLRPREIQEGERCVVNRPHIDLRYYLDPWIYDLLAWIKCFFMPDMNCQVNGLEYDLSPISEKMRASRRNSERAMNATFDNLLEGFSAEAEDWIAYMEATKPLPPSKGARIEITGDPEKDMEAYLKHIEERDALLRQIRSKKKGK